MTEILYFTVWPFAGPQVMEAGRRQTLPDISTLTTPDKNFVVIMKDGRIYKNTIQ